MYLADEGGAEIPVEGEVAEYALVQLLHQLHVEGLRVGGAGQEVVDVVHAVLRLPQVVVGHLAELGALVHVLEPHLPSCST